MLEPLIVLTVLNCVFMFSSTVTTCALWWQYRTHRCCFKRTSSQNPSKADVKKLKSCTCRANKFPTKSKVDHYTEPIQAEKATKGLLDNEKRKVQVQKRRPTKLKYLSQYGKKSPVREVHQPATEKPIPTVGSELMVQLSVREKHLRGHKAVAVECVSCAKK